MNNRFLSALRGKNFGPPPVWMMRQAGRYHSHYQELRKKYSFLEICKIPEVACEAALGPVRDFGFDAAILFSDLLFPLEAMGMGLTYDEGPQLSWHLQSKADLKKLEGGALKAQALSFQGRAMQLTREKLPPDKGLIGFVGGPLTLFFYAAEGRHEGELKSAKEGLRDGRFDGFLEHLLDLLAHNMALQAHAGADTVAILDTCAGELDPETFEKKAVPALRMLLERFIKICPQTPVTYYSKGTSPAHWEKLRGLPIQCLGVDWKENLASVLNNYGTSWAIQGNIDPHWLLLEEDDLRKRLREVFYQVKALPESCRHSWICGLGHGITPKTPESNVRLFLSIKKEVFG